MYSSVDTCFANKYSLSHLFQVVSIDWYTECEIDGLNLPEIKLASSMLTQLVNSHVTYVVLGSVTKRARKSAVSLLTIAWRTTLIELIKYKRIHRRDQQRDQSICPPRISKLN